MITTIQLNEKVKKAIGRMKEAKESYEDVIVKLLKEAEKQKRGKEEFMIEGAKEMAEDMLRITKEWEATDSTLDWEWDES